VSEQPREEARVARTQADVVLVSRAQREQLVAIVVVLIVRVFFILAGVCYHFLAPFVREVKPGAQAVQEAFP
jgi:hypothetical protein